MKGFYCYEHLKHQNNRAQQQTQYERFILLLYLM